MFAANKRLLVTLAFAVTVCGFGISQEVTSNRSVRLPPRTLTSGPQRSPRSQAVAHAHAVGQPGQQGQVQQVGLLDKLRAIGGGVSNEYQDPAEAASDPPPADWTGVPYHEPTPSRSGTRSAPMTDPVRAASRSGTRARVAVSPRTASSPSLPSTVQVPLGVGRIPTPPAEVSDRAQASRPVADKPTSDVSRPEFSPTYSSRRSNRRPVEALADVAVSPSDVGSEKVAEKREALATSTQNPIIDVDDDDVRAPTVRQRPLPEPRASDPSRSAASNEQTAAAPSLTPPSLSVDRGEDPPKTTADSPASAPEAVASNAAAAGSTSEWEASKPDAATETPAAGSRSTSSDSKSTSPQQTAASPMGIGELDQLQPVGSGVGAAARRPSSASTDTTARSFQPRSSAVSDGVGSVSPSAAESGFRSEVPAIRVVAAGPSEIMIRQETPYEIHVENRGSIDAPGVLVRAQLPNWAKVHKQTESAGTISQGKQGDSQELMWQIEKLPAGAKETLVLRLQAEQSGTFEVNVDWTLLPRKETMQVSVREPQLKLVIEGPDQVTYGESETYRVRVLNPGNGVAPNVVFTLSPNSATPQSQAIGSIPPGKEAEFEVELTAQDLGMLEIHGLATGELALRTEETKKIQVASAKLEATLSGPPLKYQNGEAIYELQVRNLGTAPSQNVVASLQLPSGLKYMGGLDEAVVKDEHLSWTIDQLDIDAKRDYQIRCQTTSTGTHRLAFQCEGTAAGKAAVSIDTKVEALADLVLSINDPPAPAPVGAEVTYEVVIRNRGSKAATAVQAITHFGEHIEPLRVEGHSGKVSTGQVEFQTIERIEPGQEITLRIVALADREGLHRFRSEVTSADTVLVAEEATRYLSADTEQISRRSGDTETR